MVENIYIKDIYQISTQSQLLLKLKKKKMSFRKCDLDKISNNIYYYQSENKQSEHMKLHVLKIKKTGSKTL